ncbi:MAG: SpoIIE family protein phosphatase, partial [Thermoanaerobaculia bacterium]
LFRSLLVLFTDGIWEATSADGRRFGTAGLERTLVAHRRRSEEEIVAEIFAAVSRHHEAAEPDDDRTLVVLRAT